MLYTLILLTVIDGQYVKNASPTRDHIPGFTTEQACKNAGEAAKSADIVGIGNFDDHTLTTYRCVPDSI
jgi:hypothetical protein